MSNREAAAVQPSGGAVAATVRDDRRAAEENDMLITILATVTLNNYMNNYRDINEQLQGHHSYRRRQTRIATDCSPVCRTPTPIGFRL